MISTLTLLKKTKIGLLHTAQKSRVLTGNVERLKNAKKSLADAIALILKGEAKCR